MHCPYCNTVNDDENSFCVSCGKTIPQDLKTLQDFVPPTEIYIPNQSAEQPSVQTAFPPQRLIPQPAPSFDQPISFQPQTPEKKSRFGVIAGLSIALLLVLGIFGAGGYYLWKQQETNTSKSVLPGHLGMFIQNAAQSNLAEIKQKDISNAVDEKDKLETADSLAEWNENDSFILYSDSKDVAITDLKLVQIDSIKDNGTVSSIDFQAVPINGNTAMKRLRIPSSLAKGKYAFALFNGYLNEGNHKFWAFQVNDTKRSNNDDIAKSATISVKETEKTDDKVVSKTTEPANKKEVETPKKDSKVAPPSGASVAYCNGNDVLLRGSPSLSGKKIGKLSKGQRIYIMYYSENYDEWRGQTANWAYVQTESGGRGWVFTPFVYY